MTVRLLLTALNCPKGDVSGNLTRHLRLLDQGHDAGCDLVLLPEMSLTGSRPSASIDLDHPAVVELVAATRGAPALCFGLVERPGEQSHDRRPFITQLVAIDGELTRVHRKRGVAPDEQAEYQPGAGSEPFRLGGLTLSMAVCFEIGLDTGYRQGSTLILAPAAPGLYGGRRRSPEDWRRGFDWWRGSVLADARRLLPPQTWLAVSTQAGATDDEDFPGWAALVGPGGHVLAELPDGHQGQLLVELPASEPRPLP